MSLQLWNFVPSSFYLWILILIIIASLFSPYIASNWYFRSRKRTHIIAYQNSLYTLNRFFTSDYNMLFDGLNWQSICPFSLTVQMLGIDSLVNKSHASPMLTGWMKVMKGGLNYGEEVCDGGEEMYLAELCSNASIWKFYRAILLHIVPIRSDKLHTLRHWLPSPEPVRTSPKKKTWREKSAT